MASLEEVFGISIEPVLSYVEREQVDGRFVEALDDHHHIVIYGSSKQGKTALRQKHVEEKRCTIIRCGPNSSPETIYQSVLRDAGVRIETFETNSEGSAASARAKWGFKAIIPWVGGADVEGEVETTGNTQKSLHSEFIGYDFGDAQAITELLSQIAFAKFIVLENFHYLPLDTQRKIAFDLKSFHEVGIRFIILGIWQEANLLLVHNGDLADRIIEIPVEPWEDTDFDRVIVQGSDVLNIEVPVSAKAEFKKNAYGNIGMLQEFLRTFCKINDLHESVSTRTELANGEKVSKTFDEKLASQRGRLIRVLEGIAGNSRTDGDDPLILPYYLVQVILTAPLEELHQGITRQNLLEKMRSLHHRSQKDTIRTGDITHLLKRLPAHQQDIQPPFLHYDVNQQRLRIVDTSQFFVLSKADRGDLKDEIPYPLDAIENE